MDLSFLPRLDSWFVGVMITLAAISFFIPNPMNLLVKIEIGVIPSDANSTASIRTNCSPVGGVGVELLLT